MLLLLHCICVGAAVSGGAREKTDFHGSALSGVEQQVEKNHCALLCLGKQESGHPDLVVTQRLPGSLQSPSNC